MFVVFTIYIFRLKKSCFFRVFCFVLFLGFVRFLKRVLFVLLMVRRSKREQRRKRNNLIVSLLMIFLMVFSIIAISVIDSSPTSGFEYNGFEFNEKVVFDDVLFFDDILKYYTVINGEEVQFFFPPGRTSQVNVSEENLSYLGFADVIYFTRNPLNETDFNVNAVFFEYLTIEYNRFSFKAVGQGLTRHTLFESDVPIIGCDDASSNSLVFYLSEEPGQPSIVEVEPFCFKIQGNGEDLLFVSDYLLYKTHGVI